MSTSPIEYLFDVCTPVAPELRRDYPHMPSGDSYLENLFEYADAREHLKELSQADPVSMDDQLLTEVTLIIEIYQRLIPEMMTRDGEGDDDATHGVCNYSLALLEEVVSVSADLARQHAALEAEQLRRSPEPFPVNDDFFWNAYINFFPSEDVWDWPELPHDATI